MDPAALDLVSISIFACIALLCGVVMQLFTDGFFSGFLLGIAGTVAGPFLAGQLGLDPLLVVPIGASMYAVGWALLGALSLSLTYAVLSRIQFSRSSRTYA